MWQATTWDQICMLGPGALRLCEKVPNNTQITITATNTKRSINCLQVNTNNHHFGRIHS
jgi:hypothetical protein